MTDITKRRGFEAVEKLQPEDLRRRTVQAWAAPEPEYGMLPRRLFARLIKRVPLLIAVFVIVVVPAGVATYLATPLYRSVALVQVNPDPVQLLPYRDVADPSGGAANIDNYMGTQEQILRGPSLKARVIERLRNDYRGTPAESEASDLGSRFGLRRIEKSELFELSYRAADPEAAATIVNLFAEEYVKQNFEFRQTTRLKAEQDLKKELEGLEARLQVSEKELTAYAKSHDIVSLEQGQVDPLQERLSSLGLALVQAEGEVVSARSSYDSLKSSSVADFPQRLVTQEIGQLQGRILQLEQELTNLRSTFGENWPAVREKRTELALVGEQLRNEQGAVLARHREQARLDLEAAEARRSMSAAALAEQKALVNQFHDASIQYNILKREADTNRNLYDGLLQRLRQTGVLAGFQFGNIQVVEPGKPRHVADSPRVAWNLGLAAVLGLALGFCAVVAQEAWDDSIVTLEDAEQLAPLPMLGSVPLMRAVRTSSVRRALPGAVSSDRPALLGIGVGTGAETADAAAVPFEVTESIRTICASVLLSRSDERPRVLVVTSATHSEGKTTTVGHLGKAFADAGVRTLLVEADMRQPDLSRSFAIGHEDGLSLYLAGHVSPGPKVHQTGIANLFLVAAGPVPPNPAALLHSERLGAFLRAAAAEFELVIFDAPPVLSMADARILATNADGVVLVVRAGRTGKTLVRRAASQLESDGGNVLGMILNGWQPGRDELAYYRYYHTPA